MKPPLRNSTLILKPGLNSQSSDHKTHEGQISGVGVFTIFPVLGSTFLTVPMIIVILWPAKR